MTSRILPRDEWARLEGTLLWPAAKSFDPESVVMVVERDGRIVGCAAYYPQWHLDGVWIAPDVPPVGVGRRLLTMVKRVAQEYGIRSVWAMAMSARSQKLIQSLGPVFHLDCEHYDVCLRGK